MPTQKQLLEQNIRNQEEILKHIGNLKGEVSAIKNHIYNNPRTGEKGMKATQGDHEERIQKLETDVKLTNGKIGVVITVVATIGGFFTWLFGVFDN